MPQAHGDPWRVYDATPAPRRPFGASMATSLSLRSSLNRTDFQAAESGQGAQVGDRCVKEIEPAQAWEPGQGGQVGDGCVCEAECLEPFWDAVEFYQGRQGAGVRFAWQTQVSQAGDQAECGQRGDVG